MRNCCRCNKTVDIADFTEGMTAGYYDVRGNAWEQFSDANEDFICDSCMWKDPRYRVVYGVLIP